MWRVLCRSLHASIISRAMPFLYVSLERWSHHTVQSVLFNCDQSGWRSTACQKVSVTFIFTFHRCWIGNYQKCEISDNKHLICGKLVLPLTYQNGCATLWWTCSFVSFYLLTAFLTTITQHTIWAWRHFYFEILLWSNLHQYRCAHIKTCYWNNTCLVQSVQFFCQSFKEWTWFSSPDIFT